MPPRVEKTGEQRNNEAFWRISDNAFHRIRQTLDDDSQVKSTYDTAKEAQKAILFYEQQGAKIKARLDESSDNLKIIQRLETVGDESINRLQEALDAAEALNQATQVTEYREKIQLIKDRKEQVWNMICDIFKDELKQHNRTGDESWSPLSVEVQALLDGFCQTLECAPSDPWTTEALVQLTTRAVNDFQLSKERIEKDVEDKARASAESTNLSQQKNDVDEKLAEALQKISELEEQRDAAPRPRPQSQHDPTSTDVTVPSTRLNQLRKTERRYKELVEKLQEVKKAVGYPDTGGADDDDEIQIVNVTQRATQDLGELIERLATSQSRGGAFTFHNAAPIAVAMGSEFSKVERLPVSANTQALFFDDCSGFQGAVTLVNLPAVLSSCLSIGGMHEGRLLEMKWLDTKVMPVLLADFEEEDEQAGFIMLECVYRRLLQILGESRKKVEEDKPGDSFTYCWASCLLARLLYNWKLPLEPVLARMNGPDSHKGLPVLEAAGVLRLCMAVDMHKQIDFDGMEFGDLDRFAWEGVADINLGTLSMPEFLLAVLAGPQMHKTIEADWLVSHGDSAVFFEAPSFTGWRVGAWLRTAGGWVLTLDEPTEHDYAWPVRMATLSWMIKTASSGEDTFELQFNSKDPVCHFAEIRPGFNGFVDVAHQSLPASR